MKESLIPCLMMKLLATLFLLLGCVVLEGCAFAPQLTRQARSPTTIRGDFRQQQRLNNAARQPLQLCMSVGDDGRPDPSILISAKDDTTQRLAFVGAFAALAAGTSVCINLWHGPGEALLGTEGFENICRTVFPIVFGTIFMVVGVLHFVAKDNFVLIVPPRGTWGNLWQAPAPFADKLGVTYEEYHTYWTGIAEFLGGLALLAGGLGFTDTQVPAILLFLLTIGVTPANLYMFTHDAHPGESVPRLAYPGGHIARFVLQCGLLSNFWIMAFK